MLDGRSRVTVVGAKRRVDVALPTDAPVGEYSAALANLCGQDRRGTVPAAWSLAVAGALPLPLTESLADSGVVDGQVLYLRDLGTDQGAEPIVTDIDELIAAEADNQRARDWPRPYVLLSFGLLWLAVAATLVPGWAGNAAVTTALALIIAGLLALGTGWALAQQRTPVPPVLCVLTSLAAVPCFAVAGGLLAQVLAGDAFGWTGVAGGASVAALMSLAATPEAVVVLIGLQSCIVLALTVPLTLLHADRPQIAATAVLAALATLGLAKPAAASVTVRSQRPPAEGVAPAHAATALLVRSRRLLTVLLVGPTLALAVALPVLAWSDDTSGIAMAAVASVALLVRARQAGFDNELVPLGGAGLAGIFAVLAVMSLRIEHSGAAVGVTLVVAGLLLVAIGVVATVRRPVAAAASELPPGFPAGAGRPSKRLIDLLGVFCQTAAAALALGVFGVFGELLAMGRGLVG